MKHDAKLQKKTMHNFETQYKTTNTIQNSETQYKILKNKAKLGNTINIEGVDQYFYMHAC